MRWSSGRDIILMIPAPLFGSPLSGKSVNVRRPESSREILLCYFEMAGVAPQVHRKCSSIFRIAFDFEMTSMSLGNPFYEGKSDAPSCFSAGYGQLSSSKGLKED